MKLRHKTTGDLALGSSIPNAASYNYIRKWEVDISALQAQLANPRGERD
jgi:hypothetical protein